MLKQQRSLFNWSKLWSNRSIYPPSAKLITTNNRLYNDYVSSANELHNYLLIKQPLLLNFTVQADPQYNVSTKLLFDILANKEKYPLDSDVFPVHLVNITCDSLEAKDLMLTYGVNKLPTLVRLFKQLPVDYYVPKGNEFKEAELVEWLKNIRS